MSELERLDERLGSAWQALSPPADLQARVRARLSSPSAAGVAAPSGPIASRWHALRASGALGAAIGAVLLGLGVALGHLIPRAPADVSRAPEPASLSAASAPTMVTPSANPRAPESPAHALATSPPQTLAASPRAPSSPTTLPESVPQPAEAEHRAGASGVAGLAAHSSRRSPSASNAAARSRAHTARPRPSSPAADRTELSLLERAERAVRAKHPALALALIEELEQLHPDSPLQEERRSIELMAHCQTQGPAGDTARRIESFARRYPESAYSARIAAECGSAESPVPAASPASVASPVPVASPAPLTNRNVPDIDGAEGENDVRNDAR